MICRYKMYRSRRKLVWITRRELKDGEESVPDPGDWKKKRAAKIRRVGRLWQGIYIGEQRWWGCCHCDACMDEEVQVYRR